MVTYEFAQTDSQNAVACVCLCRANRFAKCDCLRVPARARPRSSPARPDPTRRSRSEFVDPGEDSAEDLQGGLSKRIQRSPREKSPESLGNHQKAPKSAKKKPESARKRQKAPESARMRQQAPGSTRKRLRPPEDSHAHTSSPTRAQLGPN